MRCVHCEQSIKSAQHTFQYPLSRATAHQDCVSVVSIYAMDALLVARQLEIAQRAAARDERNRGNTRRVYSTERPGVVEPFTDNTRTGRIRK